MGDNSNDFLCVDGRASFLPFLYPLTEGLIAFCTYHVRRDGTNCLEGKAFDDFCFNRFFKILVKTE